ncbi:GntR family transcriptional regulator [Actinospica sp.]|uniref:GntR family transcriptional regulator n=1 Tax=Actinospica sp. TaxID=1872142 RepID=UPI002CDC346A|nr:GntR family transcriptional regulator [Actinospica sp.]HWG22890.1 GntR family transcriptional regulator [Actinospica sp.]
MNSGSTAERMAVILRDRITAGELTPGTRLIEEAMAEDLGVSRNTLREAFRLLTYERLLVYELNRGVFVRTLSERDVVELYRVRRMIEMAALRESGKPESGKFGKVADSVREAEKAAEEGRWHDVGTANMRFHRELVGLAGGERVEEFMAQILAELRLVFHVMKDPRRFHEPYIGRNRAVLAALLSGDIAGAEKLLREYLDDSERQLLAAYHG